MRLSEMQRSKASRTFGTVILGAAAILSLTLASGTLRARALGGAPTGTPTTAQMAGEEKSGANAVSIDNFSFGPMQLEVPVGTQVTWINKDDVPHTVVSVDHKFKSRALDTDESFSFTFTDAGTYEYFCSVHPKMTGKIVVK
ncbi:MAG TPA: cupredoxin family copper-binding protein [Candidatus Acidoferrales bacterium]